MLSIAHLLRQLRDVDFSSDHSSDHSSDDDKSDVTMVRQTVSDLIDHYNTLDKILPKVDSINASEFARNNMMVFRLLFRHYKNFFKRRDEEKYNKLVRLFYEYDFIADTVIMGYYDTLEEIQKVVRILEEEEPVTGGFCGVGFDVVKHTNGLIVESGIDKKKVSFRILGEKQPGEVPIWLNHLYPNTVWNASSTEQNYMFKGVKFRSWE